MNKIRVIDLLNKIANGEEVPKIIKYRGWILAYDRQSQDYYCEEYGNLFEYLINERRTSEFLNNEVEILEEQKKIPEKLKIEQDTPNSNYYIRNEHGTKCALTKHSKMIVETLNEIIDYLESKGE